MTRDDSTTFTFEHDGLRLAGRLWGARAASAADDALLPIVCLPGLTRNSRDFAAFAYAVRQRDPERMIVAFDYRGRGLSQQAGTAETYTVPAEAADTIAGLAHLGIARAVFVGTSRGALIIHALAAMHPACLAGAVLNDAGPRIETEGLRHIRDTVGVVESHADWDAAIAAVATANAASFPALSHDDFARMARAGFTEREGKIVGDYDRKLLDPLRIMDLDTALPELWDAFDLMQAIPLLVIRGENSSLFSRDTVAQMADRHQGMETIEVAGQGHAPFLETAGLPERILTFVKRAERRGGGAEAASS
ncbi:alpha/beta fold hydrolase [Jiella mangrovi]|uniref:Alpha/beta hydrolase n=1 Tax=Jiella mangrovi TaxID=2821407 RepID=A0ABS4BGW9_9HYPH|nr:alpha/beta hydrolase [Jiella mangrovi]MBP0615998.1 alpha/beta hydrolase [Jiella mangrovi]